MTQDNDGDIPILKVSLEVSKIVIKFGFKRYANKKESKRTSKK